MNKIGDEEKDEKRIIASIDCGSIDNMYVDRRS